MKLRLIIGALVTVGGLLAGQGVAQAAPNNQESFLFSGQEGSDDNKVVATGVFDGVGVDTEVNGKDTEGPNGRFSFVSNDKFVFDEGKLLVRITGAGRETFDEENCAVSGSGRASYRITGGTKIFRGARGAGSGTFDFAFVGEKDDNGECVEDSFGGVFFAKLMGTLRLRGSITPG